MSKEYRDTRLYKNSDKKPCKGDKIYNCGYLHEVKGVSKCGRKLYIKGWSMRDYCNVGCSYLASEQWGLVMNELENPSETTALMKEIIKMSTEESWQVTIK